MAKKNGNSLKFFKLLGLELAALAFLLFCKYHNQEIPITKFRWQYTGNFINLLTALFVILSLMIIWLKNPSIFFKVYKIYMRLLIVGTIGLVIGKLLVMFPVPFPTMYLLDQPAKRLVVGGLFSLYQITQLIIIIYCWLGILDGSVNHLFRSFLYSCVITTGGVILIFLFLLQWKLPAAGSDENTYEVGVVLGAAVWSQNRPSPILISRLQKAIELYQAKKIARIMVTGGNAPGELSEAEVAHRYLRTYVLLETDILSEEKTSSTTDQVRFIKQHLIEKYGKDKIAVISDSYHQPRINEIAKFYDLKLKTYGAEIKLNLQHGFIYRLRESFALLTFWLFGI